MRIVDMNTSHLINTTAMICRTKMKRQHGIIDDYGLNGLSNEELDRYFAKMMKELDYRLKQRWRRH